MVVAHANSLRSIIMYLDKLSSEEVMYIYWFCFYCLHKMLFYDQ